MNYSKHYALLIERAQKRNLTCYLEKHHILPKCLGGTNANENLVLLTPEEHYVAHQLLVKMYPKNKSLVHAAIMMMPKSKTHLHRSNKMYGWLKKKYQFICKQRVGDENYSYGRRVYYDPKTLKNGKFKETEVPVNWVLGRVPKNNTTCIKCGIDTGSKLAKFCEKHRKERMSTVDFHQKGGEVYRDRKNKADYNLFYFAITTSTNWKQAIQKAGYKSDGYSRTRLKRFAKENNIDLKAD